MSLKTKHTKEQLNKLPIIGKQPKDEKEEKYLREYQEFEFYNLEQSGMSEKFPYGNTQKNVTFQFFHGGKYKLPRHVARHLENCQTPIWKWRPDGTGSMQKELTGYKPRFQMRQVI